MITLNKNIYISKMNKNSLKSGNYLLFGCKILGIVDREDIRRKYWTVWQSGKTTDLINKH
jgi:hypothetical protein